MLQRILNTINRLSSSKESGSHPDKKPQHSQEQLIQWATGCMWEGLPDSFFTAWLEYKRSKSNEVSLSYKCIINEGDEVQTFQPADDLYPAQCIEQLNQFLLEGEKNWVSCTLEFNPKTASVKYRY